MLLPARSNAAGRCIYCAFHSRRLALQGLRLRSTSAFPKPKRHSDTRLSDAYNRRGHEPFSFKNAGSKRDGNREDNKGSFAGRKGIVEKFFSGGSRPHGEQRADFRDALHARLKAMKEELRDAPIVEHLQKDKEQDGGKAESFSKIWKTFTRIIELEPNRRLPSFGECIEDDGKSKGWGVVADLKLAYARRGQRGLDDRIKYAFYGHVTGARFTESDIRNQRALADLRFPTEWYPATRVMHRTIHLHVGPTNSGKTYHALQKLEQAEKGAYAGPLRLLAHEVYTRMTAKGKRCTLVTGEERRIPEFSEERESTMTSCTVEMMPLNTTLDVAVIDEIQMIGNAERGWAWTQALLGVKAKEVHLCGEERTIPLIKELCASVGEKLEIHRYQRLSPLKVADESLNGKLQDLRKGDCIVSFSVMGIHALRRQIERATGKKVATVYGSLPPETRAQQARLFNDPNNDYDFLVASDAVGMGLNLAIKRVIFEASSKFDGVQRRTLSVADIKQIAGRAGRYRTAAQANEQSTAAQDLAAAKGEPAPPPVTAADLDTVGLVTTLEKFDFPVVRAAMEAEPEPIRTAGIFPPGPILERFSSYFPPGTPFSYVLTRLHELSLMHKRFHLCGLKDQVWIADLIEPIQNLSIADRNTICASPASKTDVDLWRELLPAYARIIAEQNGGSLVDIKELPLETLDAEVSPSREYLRELERLHKGLVSYLWLSYRFAGIFTTRALAFHVKGLVEAKIEEVLGKFSFSEAQRRKIAAKREQLLLRRLTTTETDENGDLVADPETGEEVRAATDEVDDASSPFKPERAEQVEEPVGDSLQAQTLLTSGGDRFGGEDDIEFEEPGVLEAEVESGEPTVETASSSFAFWRQQQVRGESQGSHEDEEAVASMAAAAAAQRGEETGRAAANSSG